jgi:hypothetical protein
LKIDDLLFQNIKTSFLHINIKSEKKSEKDKKSNQRHRNQPSFDPITIRSDNHLYDPAVGGGKSNGNMLVEAALVPNLSYVGIGVSLNFFFPKLFSKNICKHING